MGNEVLRENLIVRAMLAIASADERLVEAETSIIRRICKKLTGETVSAYDVAAAMETTAVDSKQLCEDLARRRDELDTATKETLIRAAYMVLMADKRIAARERKKLHDYADALKIPEIHLTAVLEDLSSLSE